MPVERATEFELMGTSPTSIGVRRLGRFQNQSRHRLNRPKMSAHVKVFGCRPMTNGAANSEGRRSKTSKGGNRGKGYVGGAGLMAI